MFLGNLKHYILSYFPPKISGTPSPITPKAGHKLSSNTPIQSPTLPPRNDRKKFSPEPPLSTQQSGSSGDIQCVPMDEEMAKKRSDVVKELIENEKLFRKQMGYICDIMTNGKVSASVSA